MKFPVLAFISVLALVSASGSAYAARPRAGHSVSHNVTRTGPQGRSLNRNTSRTVTDTGYARGTTLTGSNGKTASRTATGNYDPATKTWTRDVTATGPNGASKTKEVVRTAPKP